MDVKSTVMGRKPDMVDAEMSGLLLAMATL